MQTIGERLEEARKRKGISIREASEATKIRGDYLSKFEGSNFEINLPDIYVRGFLRSYAHFLKLNTDKILTDFAALGLGRTRESKRDPRDFLGRIDLPEATSANIPADDEQARRDAAQAPRTAPPARAGSASSSSSMGGDNRQLVKIALIVGIAVAALLILFLVVRLLSGISSPAPSAPSRPTTPSTQTNPAPSTALDNVIVLVALDNVRVKVTEKADGRVLFDGNLIRNERHAISRQGPVSVEFDVAKNLQIEKNGERFNMDGRYTRNTVP